MKKRGLTLRDFFDKVSMKHLPEEMIANPEIALKGREIDEIQSVHKDVSDVLDQEKYGGEWRFDPQYDTKSSANMQIYTPESELSKYKQ